MAKDQFIAGMEEWLRNYARGLFMKGDITPEGSYCLSLAMALIAINEGYRTTTIVKHLSHYAEGSLEWNFWKNALEKVAQTAIQAGVFTNLEELKKLSQNGPVFFYKKDEI